MNFIYTLVSKINTGSDPNSTTEINLTKVEGNTLLTNALDLTYFIAGIIAVIVIVIAGMMYINSGGDAARVAKAKNMLTYAVVGLILVIMAFAITKLVIGRF